jgi:hypothetical protein
VHVDFSAVLDDIAPVSRHQRRNVKFLRLLIKQPAGHENGNSSQEVGFADHETSLSVGEAGCGSPLRKSQRVYRRPAELHLACNEPLDCRQSSFSGAGATHHAQHIVDSCFPVPEPEPPCYLEDEYTTGGEESDSGVS